MSEKATYTTNSVRLRVTPIGKDQAFLTATTTKRCDPRRAAPDAYRQIAEYLAENRMEVVHERVFGSVTAQPVVAEARAEAMRRGGLEACTPVTYIQGHPLWGHGLAGINLHVVRPRQAGDVWTLFDEAEEPRGRAWKLDGTTFFILQNLHGLDAASKDNSRCEQSDRMFQAADKLLRRHGASYRDVFRTWIYLSDILGWYNEFNRVRNARYGTFGLMPAPHEGNGEVVLLPASTGIEGDAPNGAAATMDLAAAVRSDQSSVEVTLLSNRKQKDAFRYGSAFSRGAAIRHPDATWLNVSGTAAIDEKGVSLFGGDMAAQMHKTLDVVEALIAQEGAALADICDATIFVKREQDVETFRQVAAARKLDAVPGVSVIADVCRDELLFEMDAAAVVGR